MTDIIEKIKAAGLKGRGGAGFPTGLKWDAVQKASGERKYVVCNASEGEPGVAKDGFLLENFPAEVIAGIRIAMETIGAETAYINLKADLFDKMAADLQKVIGQLNIKILREVGGYLSGEESTMLEMIEEKERLEPRMRPPYPTESGLWGCPTLVNNVETFWAVAQIAKDEYRQERFYTISGDVQNPGVFQLPENWTIEKILHKTGNFPSENFFTQAGGGASGKIFLDTELESEVGGAGAIIVYSLAKTNPAELMKKWIEFFYRENCGKCVPCREGVYRIREILNSLDLRTCFCQSALRRDDGQSIIAPPKQIVKSNHASQDDEVDIADLKDILLNLKESSFCPLGKSVAIPMEGLLDKIMKK